MMRMMTRDGAQDHAAGDGEEHRGEADREADAGAVDDPAELVPEVAVDPHDVLRFVGLATEQVDAGRFALAHLLLADQHLLGIVGGDDRRRDGGDHHHADQAHSDDAGLAPEQALQGGLPERRRAAQQDLLVRLFGEGLRSLHAAFQGRHHGPLPLPLIPVGSAGRGSRRTHRRSC
jgi:hypothetical protein